ncbi:unnamed protein product (macronuclear) [Paramecium tetraurelia]|uniref:Uncharacterized protein n=1 Tax=Paramecium tetraurelia TaxID=5888 RepID=A0CC34_PARTE|nr:uncharacterized protein GSPATT00037135001 [Paramecium tetraurelia]CAK68351.1 unnamed protein product [Paramecium tetraurelia]|eukprot:XP_001435748.1 hypothetical protein (macronuclear) [Paramecium tetraurelia strain d4-2]
MNQFSNYLFQYQTKKVFSIYQHQCNSKSPQIRRQLDSNPNCNQNDQKYMRQFKCQDQIKHQPQTQTIINSPTNKQTYIASKVKGKGKENNNQQNANIIHYPYKNPVEVKSPQSYKQNPYHAKQPTPEFENRYENDERAQVLRLSNSGLNFRFVLSQQESEQNSEQQPNQVQNESSQQSPTNLTKSDELLVELDSVRKSKCSNLTKTKTIAIQAFESTEFDKTEDQLNKIFGSLKKVKIIKKKFSQPTIQTQGTQRTMEDDSMIKAEPNKQVKTIGGLSNIDIQSMQLRTELTDLDSQRSKSTYQDESERNFSSFRHNVVTPRKMQQNKISFLMYKKKLERKS